MPSTSALTSFLDRQETPEGVSGVSRTVTYRLSASGLTPVHVPLVTAPIDHLPLERTGGLILQTHGSVWGGRL